MNKVKVWYDGACPLCIREIALMRRLDWRARIVFLDVTQMDTVCPIDRTLLLARFHAFENGQIVSGAAAFAAMWRVIPVLKPFGYLARNALILRGLEQLYIAFLKIRPRLQRALGAKN